MTLTPFAASTLALETRALLTRLARLQPFALVMPMVGAARVSAAASAAIERYLRQRHRELRAQIRGELKIRELRRYAERELGPKFDVRAFHDQILGSGQLPLDVLEKNVKGWVEAQKPAK